MIELNAPDPMTLRSPFTPPRPGAGPAAVEAAAKEFEAMALAELLAPVFEALDTEGLGGGGMGERMFRPMLVQEFAKGISAGGGIGLSAMVRQEMLRLQTIEEAPKP